MEPLNIKTHIAANVAPGTQLLDWYEPVDFTERDVAQVVCDILLEWIRDVMKAL